MQAGRQAGWQAGQETYEGAGGQKNERGEEGNAEAEARIWKVAAQCGDKKLPVHGMWFGPRFPPVFWGEFSPGNGLDVLCTKP